MNKLSIPWTWAMALACSGAFAPPDRNQVVGIRVEPESAELRTGPEGGDELCFTAWATGAGGAESAVDLVEWSVSNRSAGTIDDAGCFTPSSLNGGRTWVIARLDRVDGQAELTSIYVDERVEGSADPAVFDGLPEQDMASSPWTYPEDGVDIPRNTPSIEFQWTDAGAVAWRLHLLSSITDLTVYTTSSSWTAGEDLWATIASTNAGGVVEAELSAAFADRVEVSSPISIEVNRMDARGSIYYWSTSAQGVMRIPFGQPAQEFLTVSQTGHCIGCHVVSRDGLIAFTYDGGDGEMGVKRMADSSDVIAYGDEAYGNFKTFSPDGRFLLSTSHGALSVWDAPTGTWLWDVPLDSPATHVDWSPDGQQVALVLADDLGGDWYFGRGRLAVMDHLGDGTFGEPRILVDFSDGSSAYYPAWSPDGEWIAFNRSTGDAYDDEDAELWVIPAAGGDPIRLDAANMTGGLTNSWPRWGPLPDDVILWLAFASKRTYGNHGDEQQGRPQLWVSAFDPARASRGDDPSWPAFWLPDQAVDQGNHIPVWTE